MLLGLDALDADELLPLVGDGLGLLLIEHDVELVTCGGGSVESEHGNGSGRTGLVNLLATFVEHGLDTAVIDSGQDHVSGPENAVLDEHRRQESAAFVKRGLYDGSLCDPLGVGLEFEQVGFQEDFLEQLVHIEALLGGYLFALVFTSPVLRQDVHLGKLLVDLVRIGTRLVDLVDCEYHRDTCSLRVVDCLDCLGHDCIVCGDDDYGKVSELCSTGTHCGKRFMSRSVEEGYPLAVRQDDIVGSDVLGDSSGFACDDV